MTNPYPRTIPLPDGAPFMMPDPRKPHWLDSDYQAALKNAANTSRDWRHSDAQRIATLEADCETWAKQVDAIQAEIGRFRKDLEKARVLVRLVTVRQVIESGYTAICAAGLDPWCISEGRATGDENINPVWAMEQL